MQKESYPQIPYSGSIQILAQLGPLWCDVMWEAKAGKAGSRFIWNYACHIDACLLLSPQHSPQIR